jgi:hypothetical protein
MAITFNTILASDLRDSSGNQIKIVEVTGVEGPYTVGGVILEPEDFGFTEILSIQAQPKVIGPSDINDPDTWTDPWAAVADINVIRTDMNLDGNYEWRAVLLLHPAGYGGAQGDGLVELPDGTPMTFFPQNAPVMTVIGSTKKKRD